MGNDQDSPGETWRDWCARNAPGSHDSVSGLMPEMLSRTELLATVERWGVKRVQESTLRYWESIGIIPRATVEGLPGHQRARYPWWVADMLAIVRQYQDRGAKVEELRGRMRAEAWRLSPVTSGRWAPVRPAIATDRPFTPAPFPEDVEDIIGLPVVEPLNALARFLTELYGAEVSAIDLHFRTVTGDSITYAIPFPYRDERPQDGG